MRAPVFPLALALLGLAACSGGEARSVLLVTLDTTRADALGAYGNRPEVTPNLDWLAAEGVLFERAFTVAPLTLPAHCSMMTGLVPPRHGVRDNGTAALPSSATTLAERAQAAGLQTAAFLGSAVLDVGFGLEQGFEVYEPPARPFRQHGLGYAERPAREVAELAIEWLRKRDPERPFFLWAHLWDPHSPYEPPAEFLERAGENPYLGEVAAADHALGLILDELEREGALDHTLVIALADHGEAFLEHDELSHGAYVWNTTLHVPLIVRRPGARDAGERVGAIASAVDVYPTALAALGIELEKGERVTLDGRDLLDLGRERGAYFESYYGFFNYGWHPLAGWVDRAGKYVHSCKPLLFDLEADPREEHDLSVERAQGLGRWRAPLEALARVKTLARDAEGLDPELRRSLQAVGYAALADDIANAPAPLSYLERPSPHERTAEQLDLQKALGLLDGGKNAEAAELLESIVRANPQHLFAWDRLALCRIRAGHPVEAIDPLERVLAGGPASADTWTWLGACRLATGEEEKALAAFTRALAIDPNHAQALGGIVNLMEGAGMGELAQPLRARFETVQSRP